MFLLKGFIVGVSMIIFIGPVFFHLLEASAERGKRHGLMAALGIILGDILFVLAVYQGFSLVHVSMGMELFVTILGFVMLMTLGIKNIRFGGGIHSTKKKKPAISVKSTLWADFVKAYLINFINPFVLVVWIFVVQDARTTGTTNLEAIGYLIASLAGIVATDLTKVLVADRLRSYWNKLNKKRIYKVLGIIFIVFSIRLLYHAFVLQVR
ncbi:MAG: threonine/homoserine/homoserine lactone efflux protein [Bacteroidia bacterium]|jgi:threonine/homoserine/homoserine lactone efflux protein